MKPGPIEFNSTVSIYLTYLLLFAGTPLQGIENVQGLDSFTICVQLTGGNGDHAWQHTQLFRQSISTTDEFPFELQITFH